MAPITSYSRFFLVILLFFLENSAVSGSTSPGETTNAVTEAQKEYRPKFHAILRSLSNKRPVKADVVDVDKLRRTVMYHVNELDRHFIGDDDAKRAILGKIKENVKELLDDVDDVKLLVKELSKRIGDPNLKNDDAKDGSYFQISWNYNLSESTKRWFGIAMILMFLFLVIWLNTATATTTNKI